jgi:hypothetical protein
MFSDITPYNVLKMNGRFGVICHLHFEGRKISQARNELATSFHAGFSLGLFCDPQDGGEMFLLNAG